MWIACKCGHILHDNTDGIRYKGRIISDREYFKLLDFIDELIESPAQNREALCMTLRTNLSGYIREKNIFQCTECGRILIEGENGKYSCFLPEDHAEKNLLDFDGSEKKDFRFLKDAPAEPEKGKPI